MKARIGYLIAAIILMLGLTSCDNHVVWCQTNACDEGGWSPLRSMEFAMQPVDSAIWQSRRPLSGILCLRYTDKCRERVVKLLVERESLDSICPPDTVTVTLFNEDGTPDNDRNTNELRSSIYKGKGLSLGVYEKRLPLFEHTVVSPMMRIAVTPLSSHPISGISHITLLIKE